jgi:predicted porin
MKRTFLALSCLACATLAQAQSSVTIYGRIDLAVTKQNSGTSALAGSNGRTGPAGNRWDLRHGSESRLGFLGSEALGGGLRAGFQIEHRFLADTGVADPVFWKARSYVYLDSKTLGNLYLGREYVPAFWPALKLDPWAWDTVGTPGLNHQFAGYRIDNHARANNSVGYKTIDYGGVTANVAMSAGEGVRSRSVGANIEYTRGPMYVAAAFDRQAGDNRVALIGGAYDFGFVRPRVSYTKSKVAGIERSNLTLAASVPLGSGIAKFAVARLDPKGADNNITKFGVGYEHLLSKRTSLYADVGSADQQGAAGGMAYTRTTAVDIGLKHNF